MAFHTAAMKPLRILLVEHDAVIGPLLAELLEELGHVVFDIEATEAGAVRAALRDKADLMIVDARLHEGSGIAAVQAVRTTSEIPYPLWRNARVASGVFLARMMGCSPT